MEYAFTSEFFYCCFYRDYRQIKSFQSMSNQDNSVILMHSSPLTRMLQLYRNMHGECCQRLFLVTFQGCPNPIQDYRDLNGMVRPAVLCERSIDLCFSLGQFLLLLSVLCFSFLLLPFWFRMADWRQTV